MDRIDDLNEPNEIEEIKTLLQELLRMQQQMALRIEEIEKTVTRIQKNLRPGGEEEQRRLDKLR